MAAQHVERGRTAQVFARLATVVDPELDEPVTELDFITEVVIDECEVRVGFRLPTYWCAANFAFLMADDMRIAVETLPWVSGVKVVLHDHMYADTINAGVSVGAGFQASFGESAEGDLEALRQTFLVKAFQRRQSALLEHLLAVGHWGAALVVLDIDGLARLPLDQVGGRLVARYLARRGAVGGGSRAFVDIEGRAIDVGALARHLHEVQRVGINAEFNGALCRGLLEARYGNGTPVEAQAQPIRFTRRSATTSIH